MQQNSRPIKYHGADLSVHYVLHYTLRRSLFNVPNVYSLAVLFRLNNQTKISQHFTAIRLVSGSLIGNLDTEIFLECQFRGKLQIEVEVLLPWIRVVVEKPMAGPGGAKEVGKRGQLWSPWTSLSGTAPIRINIQNLDVGFHWFISDRSGEITHSLLCNLLSGRSPANHSTQVWAVGISVYCFILLVSAARIDGRINRRCTFGGFSSIVNAALKKNFAGVCSFTSQQFEAWN